MQDALYTSATNFYRCWSLYFYPFCKLWFVGTLSCNMSHIMADETFCLQLLIIFMIFSFTCFILLHLLPFLILTIVKSLFCSFFFSLLTWFSLFGLWTISIICYPSIFIKKTQLLILQTFVNALKVESFSFF